MSILFRQEVRLPILMHIHVQGVEQPCHYKQPDNSHQRRCNEPESVFGRRPYRLESMLPERCLKPSERYLSTEAGQQDLAQRYIKLHINQYDDRIMPEIKTV